MVYYREHRSSLYDSLQTEKTFSSFEELIEYLEPKTKTHNVDIEYWCYDDRYDIGSTFIVTDGFSESENYNGVMGFAYLRNKAVRVCGNI